MLPSNSDEAFASAYTAGMGENGTEQGQVVQRRKLHYLYLATGWFFAALGFVGAFLPILPTTPFLLIAAWAFSQSSERLHSWLYEHPRFGSYLVNWSKYGAIPIAGKMLSVAGMTLGWTTAYLNSDGWAFPVILGIILLAVGTYIVTRPGGPPATDIETDEADSGLE